MKKILLFFVFITSICYSQINPNFSGNTYVASTGVLSVPKLTLTNLVTATTGNILYYDAGVITVGAVPGGGGITNSAAANEMAKSDGTNLVPSGVFSTTAGSLLMGNTAEGSLSRSITSQGSSANIALNLNSKGTGNIVLTSGGTFSMSFAGGANSLSFSESTTNANLTYTDATGLNTLNIKTANSNSINTRPIILTSGLIGAGGTTQNSGDVTITSGDFTEATGSGLTGNVTIKAGNNSGSGNVGDITIQTSEAKGSYLFITNLPTSCSGVPTGAIANVAGVLTVCP